jgi:hypothetical protein
MMKLVVAPAFRPVAQERRVQELELAPARPIALELKRQESVLAVWAEAVHLALLKRRLPVLEEVYESSFQPVLLHPLARKERQEVVLLARLETRCLAVARMEISSPLALNQVA